MAKSGKGGIAVHEQMMRMSMMITINCNLIDDDNDDDDDINDVSGAKLVPAVARTTWTQPPLLPEKPPAALR